MSNTLGRWRIATTRNEGLGWKRWVAAAACHARTARDELLLAGVHEDVVRLAAGVGAVLALHHLDGAGRCQFCSSWWQRVPWPCRTARSLFAGLEAAEGPIQTPRTADDLADPDGRSLAGISCPSGSAMGGAVE